MSAASAAPRTASQVPGPISVIVSKQNAPVRAQVAAGHGRLEPGASAPGAGRCTGRRDPGPDRRAGRPAPTPPRRSRGTRAAQRRGRRGAPRRRAAAPSTTGAPASVSAARIRSARSRNLDGRRPHPDPDLGARLVQPVRVRPHERDRQGHRGADPTALGSPRVSDDPSVTRLRDLGLRLGNLEPGPLNAITDVAGVRVGHVTVMRDEEPPPPGRGVARTGVTAILPGPIESLAARVAPGRRRRAQRRGRADRLPPDAGVGPARDARLLTATMAVGRVFDGLVAAICEADPARRASTTSSSRSSASATTAGSTTRASSRSRRPTPAARSRRRRAAPSREGCVGAGTGMVAFGWKGGIGTSSRACRRSRRRSASSCSRTSARREDLRIGGVPVGAGARRRQRRPGGAGGSCIAVVATDAPLGGAQLERARPPRGSRARADGLRRAPRERRDLPRLLDGAPRA